MRSAYPSSQSFFDATSDSIRAEDVHKGRSSSSFSSLADLFKNPVSKSDLFPNVRTPVFVAEEVQFPAKKKREYEERTSIWHEWGSGECQTENVAQESSGLVSDLFRPKSELVSSGSSAKSFPNLGSANISLLPEEFAFPARKKREEGSSWREERTSWPDWSSSGSATDGAPIRSRTPVGLVKDQLSCKPSFQPSNLLPSAKASVFSALSAPVGTSEELSFPARKKREERSFWQVSDLDDTPSACEKVRKSPVETMSGVSSLADLYFNPGNKCSSLFSKVSLNSSEEVVFPKRKNRADRNDWRDWRNTGYSDWNDSADQEDCVDNCSLSNHMGAETEALERDLAEPLADEGFFKDRLMDTSGSCAVQSYDRDLLGSGSLSGAVDNAAVFESSDLNTDKESNADMEAEIGRFSRESRSEDERIMDGAESSTEDLQSGATHEYYSMSRFRSCRRERLDQRNACKTGKYPPPLGSLRHGSSRVPHHMPWVQLQPIRREGRFMLQEVKVTQPVVFQPIRSEGRLVLHLIGQEGETFRGHGPHVVPASRKECSAPNMCFEENEDVACNNKKQLPTSSSTAIETHKNCLHSVESCEASESLEISGNSGERSEIVVDVLKPESISRDSVAKVEGFLLNNSGDRARDTSSKDEECGSHDFRDVGPMEVRGFEVASMRDSPLVTRESVSEDTRSSQGSLPTESRQERRSGILREQERPALSWNIDFRSSKVAGNDYLGANCHTLSRTRSLRNGLSNLTCTRAESEPTLTRSRSIRNSSLCGFATVDAGREERLPKDRVHVQVEEKMEAKYQDSFAQGMREHSFDLTSAHSFLRSLRRMSDAPGESDGRLSSYTPVTTSFSCADGMGKRHHEKRFWEQQPCVS